MTARNREASIRPRRFVSSDHRAGIATRLEAGWIAATPARRMRSDLAMEALEREGHGRTMRHLDAGSWDGWLALSIARRHPDWLIVALDRDAAGLTRGRATAIKEGLSNAHFVQADLTRPFASAIYDAVSAIECLTEIDEDQAALDRFAEALRPGGLLLLHVPHPQWKPILRSSSPVWRLEVRHGYDASELSAMLDRAGFTIERMRPTMGDTVQLAQEIRDRYKTRRLATRSLLIPFLAMAARLELRGITRGQRRGLFIEARRR